MGTTPLNYREDDTIVEQIDEIVGNDGNRSNFIKKAVRNMLEDPAFYNDRIEELEQEQDEDLKEKQRIERRMERRRRNINDLKDKRSEAKTLQKVRDQISDKRIDKVKDVVRQNKYDNDPRASTPAEVIEFNAERIAEDEGLKVELVERVLKMHVSV